MTTKKIKHGDRVRRSILDAGARILASDPEKLTARAVGNSLGLTHSAVLYYFHSTDGLRKAVAAHAVETRNADAIAYLIVTKNPAVAGLSDRDRREYSLGV